MTDTQKAAMEQALEALEDHAKQYPHMQKGYTVDAITALRAALAEQSTEHNPTFEELEVAILDDFRSTGHLLPEPVIPHASDPIHIGNMVIDLILLAKNMNLDLVSCLIAARNEGIKK